MNSYSSDVKPTLGRATSCWSCWFLGLSFSDVLRLLLLYSLGLFFFLTVYKYEKVLQMEGTKTSICSLEFFSINFNVTNVLWLQEIQERSCGLRCQVSVECIYTCHRFSSILVRFLEAWCWHAWPLSVIFPLGLLESLCLCMLLSLQSWSTLSLSLMPTYFSLMVLFP